jgi:hypothetical protein
MISFELQILQVVSKRVQKIYCGRRLLYIIEWVESPYILMLKLMRECFSVGMWKRWDWQECLDENSLHSLKHEDGPATVRGGFCWNWKMVQLLWRENYGEFYCVYILNKMLHSIEIIWFTSVWNKVIKILKFCSSYAITLCIPFPWAMNFQHFSIFYINLDLFLTILCAELI